MWRAAVVLGLLFSCGPSPTVTPPQCPILDRQFVANAILRKVTGTCDFMPSQVTNFRISFRDGAYQTPLPGTVECATQIADTCQAEVVCRAPAFGAVGKAEIEFWSDGGGYASLVVTGNIWGCIRAEYDISLTET
jgi:hypothetical protein